MPPVSVVDTFNLEERQLEDQHSKTNLQNFSIEFRLTVIILGFIAFASTVFWFLWRTRQQLHLYHSSESAIQASDISIEIGEEDGIEIDHTDEDGDRRTSREKDFTTTSTQSFTFPMGKLPTLNIDRKPRSILERRGKEDLTVRPPDAADVDMVLVEVTDEPTVSPSLSRKTEFQVPALPPNGRHSLLIGGRRDHPLSGIATAPLQLENTWRRPLNVSELH